MTAWAAAAEDAAYGAEPFYATTDFWVLVGFVIFFLLVGKVAYRVVTVALDDRAERIKDQIDEAQRLSEEAQELLASYERRQREAETEAEAIIDHARREADRLADEAEQALARSLKRREQLALDRIAQAEASAAEEVRALAVEVAMQATRALLAETLTDKRADALVDDAIKTIPDKLH